MQTKYDEEVIHYFIRKEKQERYRYMLQRPEHRSAVINELYDLNDFRLDCLHWVPETRPEPEKLCSLLRSHGAGQEAYVISPDEDIDGVVMPLITALQDCAGSNILTVVYCFNGKLGYCETDGARCFLRRAANK